MKPFDRRLLRETPALGRFLFAEVLLAALSAAVTIAWAVLIGKVVSGVFLEHRDLSAIAGLLVALTALALVRALIVWIFELSGHAASRRVRRSLRQRVLSAVVAARPAGLRDLRAGELAAGATSGLEALDPYFSRFLPQLVQAVVISPAILVWVFAHDLVSALIMSITLPLIPLFAVLIGRAAEERTKRRLRALSLMSAHFLDVVRGLATLRAYRRGKAQAETIAETTERFRRETMGTLRVAFLSALVLELAATIGIALIAVSIGLRLVDGKIGLATAFSVLVLAPELYLPMRGVAAQFHASSDGLAAAGRAFELIDLAPAVFVSARPLPTPDLSVTPIRLEAVGFAYEGRPEAVFSGFDCELRPGEHLVVAGESGAGKTTLLSLLLRFADPQSGRIGVGEVDLRELDPDDWRRQLAWLPQHPCLFAGSVAEALRLAAPGADDPRLWSALEAAGAASFVSGLPDGLATAIGEGGVRLSAGEVRRLALARALLRDAPLLILDEPTAHLDSAAAAAIRQALAAIDGGRTVVIATHDAELLRLADRVVALGSEATSKGEGR